MKKEKEKEGPSWSFFWIFLMEKIEKENSQSSRQPKRTS